MIQAWDERAKAEGFGGGGFVDWLVAVVRREKAAMEERSKAKAKK